MTRRTTGIAMMTIWHRRWSGQTFGRVSSKCRRWQRRRQWQRRWVQLLPCACSLPSSPHCRVAYPTLRHLVCSARGAGARSLGRTRARVAPPKRARRRPQPRPRQGAANGRQHGAPGRALQQRRGAAEGRFDRLAGGAVQRGDVCRQGGARLQGSGGGKPQQGPGRPRDGCALVGRAAFGRGQGAGGGGRRGAGRVGAPAVLGPCTHPPTQCQLCRRASVAARVCARPT